MGIHKQFRKTTNTFGNLKVTLRLGILGVIFTSLLFVNRSFGINLEGDPPVSAPYVSGCTNPFDQGLPTYGQEQATTLYCTWPSNDASGKQRVFLSAEKGFILQRPPHASGDDQFIMVNIKNGGDFATQSGQTLAIPPGTGNRGGIQLNTIAQGKPGDAQPSQQYSWAASPKGFSLVLPGGQEKTVLWEDVMTKDEVLELIDEGINAQTISKSLLNKTAALAAAFGFLPDVYGGEDRKVMRLGGVGLGVGPDGTLAGAAKFGVAKGQYQVNFGGGYAGNDVWSVGAGAGWIW